MWWYRAGFALLLFGLLFVAFVTSAYCAPAGAATEPQDCVARLAMAGIAAEHAGALPKPRDATCVIDDPVRLLSVVDPALADRRIAFPDKPLLACAMADRFARFTAEVAAPLTLGVFGKELVAVPTGPGHECRTRNRQAGGKPSSHGRGLAVDIAHVALHGGAKVVVAAPAGPLDMRFLTALRAAACGSFNTVLGPGADAAHADHIHIDMEPRGRDGKSKFCQ
jgi:hypothetical protein